MAAFMKSREFGGMISKKKQYNHLPSPPRYVRLSSKENDNDNDNDNDNNNVSRRFGRNEGSGSGRGGTPKGHVPVLVGLEEDELKRFVVPTRYMNHPSIVELLQLSADEFGFNNQGVLHIPCHPQYFETLLCNLNNNNRS
ncbi:unnamed protein product [Amaranthus hypochondriacus]